MNDRAFARLREENDEMREELRQLKAEFHGEDLRCPVRLTAQRARVARMLRARSPHVVRRDTLITALERADTAAYADTAYDWTHLAVIVCHLRKALKPFGIAIENEWGVGFSMSRASAQAWDAALAAQDEPVAE